MATKSRRPPAPARITLGSPAPGAPGQRATRTKTIADAIVEAVEAGVDPQTAAGTVGMSVAELTAYMRQGVLVGSRLQAGQDWSTEFTAEEQDAHVFAARMISARSWHVAKLAKIAAQAAEGGLVRRSTRSKKLGKKIVEVQELVEYTLPDTDMVKWALERLAPEVWGQRSVLNVNVVDLTDTPEQGDLIQRRLAEISAGLLERRAIEATATDE